MSIRHVLCAVDGSDASLRAVALSAEFATSMGARLTIVSVRTFHMDRTAAAGLHTPEEVADILAQAAELAARNGVAGVETVQLRGRDAAVAIADYAEEHQVDLICAGSTGKDALQRFAFGSTSMDLLRKSALPVTIVH